MTQSNNPGASPARPLRLWPGVVLVALILLGRFVLPAVVPGTAVYGLLGSLAGSLLVATWWVFFSRAAGAMRWAPPFLMVLGIALTSLFVHPSIATGAMGLLPTILSVPFLCLTFVLWSLTAGRMSQPSRIPILALLVMITCAPLTLLRTEGMMGEDGSILAWRWTATLEEQLLAEAPEELAAIETNNATEQSADVLAQWPGFRGPQRDSILFGTEIADDWATQPPVEVWRKPIGPGWSSFAVRGEVFFTQEQRGEEEVVSCYRLDTGQLVWRHADPIRFWESNAGAGPRATPTLSGERVYTMGATGFLNALSARDGSVVWSHDVAAETETQIPEWAVSGSPLVVDDLVIVSVSSTLAAYDLVSGKLRWLKQAPGESYCSPHLATLHGVEQVIMNGAAGAFGVLAAEGQELWQYAWPTSFIVQPAVFGEGSVLVGGAQTRGMQRIDLTLTDGQWVAEMAWKTSRLKPDFSDFVIHKGHAYGLDGAILTCINVSNGKRVWKGGRYGHGQLLLLADQDRLLLLTETGELAFVSATPDEHLEFATAPAIEGKTWNHPVLIGDLLLVRNDHEMGAYRLPTRSN